VAKAAGPKQCHPKKLKTHFGSACYRDTTFDPAELEAREAKVLRHAVAYRLVQPLQHFIIQDCFTPVLQPRSGDLRASISDASSQHRPASRGLKKN